MSGDFWLRLGKRLLTEVLRLWAVKEALIGLVVDILQINIIN
jgi:hypothetical protein